jgi:hypothetical protein
MGHGPLPDENDLYAGLRDGARRPGIAPPSRAKCYFDCRERSAQDRRGLRKILTNSFAGARAIDKSRPARNTLSILSRSIAAGF